MSILILQLRAIAWYALMFNEMRYVMYKTFQTGHKKQYSAYYIQHEQKIDTTIYIFTLN